MNLPHEFNFPVGREVVDVELCVMSGQVFRWVRAEGGLVGMNGGSVWRLEPLSIGGWRVASNRPKAEWERFLRLDAKLPEILAELKQKGPELAPALAATPGLRILRPSSRWEALAGFLCTPNNNVARISSMVRALGRFGEPLGVVAGIPAHAFPSPGVVAAIHPDELRRAGFGYRAPRIVAAAQHVTDQGGAAWLESLAAGSYEDAFGALSAIHGIGAKLADCICLFALDHLEAVPVDTHIWQAACRIYFPEWSGKAVTETRYRAVGSLLRDRFGDKAAWAQQMLFTHGSGLRRKPA